jgi:cell division protein FtsI (penicillin-binding protein 3)
MSNRFSDDLHSRFSQRPRSSSALANRLLIVWGLLVLACLGLLIKLFTIQIVDGAKLSQEAQRRQQVSQRSSVPRRPIVDRYGDIIAADQASYTIYAHPKMFKKGKDKLSNKDVATALSPILQVSSQELLTKFEKHNTGILLGRRLTQEVRDQIATMKNDGIEIQQSLQDYRRIYPQDEVAAEVLGYVDFNYKAQAGVERSQESLIERQMREFRISKTGGSGGTLPDYATEEFLHHDDLKLKLTIDMRLQRVARKSLRQQILKWKALRGTVIIMDAQTGAIRSMVTEPTFNPNKFNDPKYPPSVFRNWAIADLYEPGSTFKPLNVAIALENKVITPATLFNDTGSVTIGPHTIRNSDKRGHGPITAAQVLQYSSNVGMVEMMRHLQPEIYYSWLERLELGRKVGIDLPFEAQGTLKDRNQFLKSPIEPATTAFGQGLSMTPIQLVTMTGALANGGKLVRPYVVEGLFDSNGVRQDVDNRPSPRQIFSPENTEEVLKMMQSVVETGTGGNAKISGFDVAGKTGTAQKASKTGGYQKEAKITSFIGVLPVSGPRRYVIFAAVDEPTAKGEAFGGTVAAPIVKDVMDALILQEKIVPVDIKKASETPSPSPETPSPSPETPSPSPTTPSISPKTNTPSPSSKTPSP